MNEQIKHEVESMYLYLAMAANFHESNFDGMAKWMRAQAAEEMAHGMRFYNHILEREGHVDLMPIEISKKKWTSPLEAFKDAYKHEQFITSKIHGLAKTAQEENDFPAASMLQWFIDEQVEEESTALKVVQKLERIGDFGYGLQMLDTELGTRQTNWMVVQGPFDGVAVEAANAGA